MQGISLDPQRAAIPPTPWPLGFLGKHQRETESQLVIPTCFSLKDLEGLLWAWGAEMVMLYYSSPGLREAQVARETIALYGECGEGLELLVGTESAQRTAGYRLVP